MSHSKQAQVYIAVDLGASSGRVMAGVWLDKVLGLVEVHRFLVPSAHKDGKIRWDVSVAFESVLLGLKKAVDRYGDDIVSIGVDTWAVDYGLLDSEGELLEDPVCYRDSRTEGLIARLDSEISKGLIFSETGIQFLSFNTIYQLVAEIGDEATKIGEAKRLLLIPDLINYWLTGRQVTERTNASTTQMLNPISGDWSTPLLRHVGVDSSLLGDIVEPGTLLGKITSRCADAIGKEGIDVVTVASHDTASAFVALPSAESNYAILSSGTWSIMGLELENPQLENAALEAGFSNEIGFGKSVRFLKNICGLWLIEESLRHWDKEGTRYSYSDLVSMAQTASPLVFLIDPDDSRFASPGDMPERIRAYCAETNQAVPESDAEIVRCIFDSMVMKYRVVFDKLSQFAPAKLEGLFILGGGSKNGLLNQMTADALNVPVLAGPAEATAIGNIAVQMIAKGEFSDINAARAEIGQSFGPKRFVPTNNVDLYENASERFEALLRTGEFA